MNRDDKIFAAFLACVFALLMGIMGISDCRAVAACKKMQCPPGWRPEMASVRGPYMCVWQPSNEAKP